MNELSIFDPFFTDDACFFPRFYTQKSNMPLTDITEDKKGYTITMELPGLGQDDIEISLKDNILTVASKKEEKSEKEEKPQWLLRERSRLNFTRNFSMPKDINPEAVKASYKNGLLTIEIERRSECAEKKITIQAA